MKEKIEEKKEEKTKEKKLRALLEAEFEKLPKEDRSRILKQFGRMKRSVFGKDQLS